MARETWGTYSVRDHLVERPWAADVLLYDRLVIPVPVDPSAPAEGYEWQRWTEQRWDPGRQRRLLEVLGERAYPVLWNKYLQEEWAQEWRAGVAGQVDREADVVNPYELTARLLTRGLPIRVTAVTAVATYRSEAELTEALHLRAVGARQQMPAGQMAVVMGRKFLVPDRSEYSDDFALLKRAVDVASDDEFRNKRAAYWKWQRDYLNDALYADPDSIQDSIAAMSELVHEELHAVKMRKVKCVTMFAFCIASVGVSLLAAPLAPLALAGAFLSIGQFSAEKVFAKQERSQPSAATLLIAGRRSLGWEE